MSKYFDPVVHYSPYQVLTFTSQLYNCILRLLYVRMLTVDDHTCRQPCTSAMGTQLKVEILLRDLLFGECEQMVFSQNQLVMLGLISTQI